MHLVVGLGNPGPRYALNRHNVGFRVVERLAGAAPLSDAHLGRAARVEIGGAPALLLMPQTFMNRSGASIAAAAAHHEIEPARILIVHDELDVPLGRLKLKRGGGVAGHNGLRSAVEHLGTPDFVRLRVGIGRPDEGSVYDWVLGDFSASANLEDVLDDAAQAVERVLTEGVSAAMNHINARVRPSDAPASEES